MLDFYVFANGKNRIIPTDSRMGCFLGVKNEHFTQKREVKVSNTTYAFSKTKSSTKNAPREHQKRGKKTQNDKK